MEEVDKEIKETIKLFRKHRNEYKARILCLFLVDDIKILEGTRLEKSTIVVPIPLYELYWNVNQHTEEYIIKDITDVYSNVEKYSKGIK